MKLTTLRLLTLATAVIALNACSSEPSDWRPENKVSVDTVEPGYRSSDSFNKPSEHGQGARHSEERNESPANLHGPSTDETHADHVHAPGGPGAPAAEATISANAEEGMRKRGEMHDEGKSSQDDTTASGHQVQR